MQVWNTSGGGLVAEFNVWDNRRHTLPPCKRALHSVTTMSVNEAETTLYTGNSLGYIQVHTLLYYIMFLCIIMYFNSVYLQLWDISNYCLHNTCDEATPTVNKTPPPLKLTWRAHLLSVVSIDTAEESGVVVTASTDCTVRLWTQKGCYIGMETWDMES